MSQESVRPAMLQHPGRVPGDANAAERTTAGAQPRPHRTYAPSLAQPRPAYDERQIARAAYFTAVLFRGRGQYDRREARTLAEIRTIAGGMSDPYGRRPMIYAVSPEGLTIHVID